MAQNSKPAVEVPSFWRPPSHPPEVHPEERQKVDQLIAVGQSKNAVELCKEIHQRRQSAQSEALLLHAYSARLRSLMDRNLAVEARQLVDSVSQRYPSARAKVAEWNVLLNARNGSLESLVAPLADPSLPADKQAAIGLAIRRDIVDLRALASCSALPPQHPLRIAAGALWQAFEAVTSGPVAEEALALHEVSRQSPLAPWKMLVRAIAAYYRHDDALCQKFMAAVDADSAPARLAPSLHALIHKKEAPNPAAKFLASQTNGDREKLRDTLKALDRALDSRKLSHILPAIRAAVTACSQSEPGLLVRLKQHISIRAMIAGAKPQPVTQAMDGPSLKNSSFWRLLARATEEDRGNPVAVPQACSLWEEFRKHAIQEGSFPAKGPEVAAIYLHMDDLWRRVSPETAEHFRARFPAISDGHAEYYRGQPPEIRALAPRPGTRDLYFLSPFQILERACEADPCSENFARWLRSADGAPKLAGEVAESWSLALPRDIPPLLHLMESAEKRNALKKAFKYMEAAEEIDGLNPEVRRARLRLLVAMAIRHLKERKTHLADGELRQLEELPQAQPGDRPAFISALRWVTGFLGGRSKGILEVRAEMVRVLGSELAALVVLEGVARRCGLDNGNLPQPPKGVAVSSAIGRACALGDDMGVPCEIPENLFDRIEKEITSKEFRAPAAALIALGETAVRQELLPMAYAIAGAGLAQGLEGQARFLYLRARGMPPWESERRSRCLAAASELARRQRDSDLLNRIGEFRDEEMKWLDEEPDARATAISAEEIARVVERESERGYPKSKPPADWDEELCPCPACRAERGEMGVPPELEAMMEEFGPEVVAKALAELVGIDVPAAGGKRRKRRSFSLDDLDIPF